MEGNQVKGGQDSKEREENIQRLCGRRERDKHNEMEMVPCGLNLDSMRNSGTRAVVTLGM